MTTLDALGQLDVAITNRIEMENRFIDQMVTEFQRISNGLQQTVASDPQMAQEMQGYINRINEATQKLNDSKYFGNQQGFDEAVQRVLTRGGWKSRKSRNTRRNTRRTHTFRRK